MINNLKPCPLCGGEALLCYNKPVGQFEMYWILCRDCHTCPGSRSTQQLAEETWQLMPNDHTGTPNESDYEVAERAMVAWGRAINGPHVAVLAAQMARQRECKRLRATEMPAPPNPAAPQTKPADRQRD